jgi:hypothetical protein
LRLYRDVPAIDRGAPQCDDWVKMNWSLLIGPIVFLVVFAAVWGAFPKAAKSKPPESRSAHDAL